MDFNSVLLLLCSIVGLGLLILIQFGYKGQIYQRLLFSIFVFSLSYNALVLYMISSGAIMKHPNFYRTASPFLYTVSISLFLLARSLERRQDKASWQDLLWFAIPILHIIELIPFYFQDTASKMAVLEKVRNQQDYIIYSRTGLLPTFVQYMLQLGLGVVLCGYTFAKTLRYRKKQPRSRRSKILLWLNSVSLYMMICFAVLFVLLVIGTAESNTFSNGLLIYSYTLVLTSLSFILAISILFTFRSKDGSAESDGRSVGIFEGANADEKQFIEALETFFKEDNRFLDSSFRLQDLADAVELPRNFVSSRINSLYNKNFNEFLNEKRIGRVLEKIDKGKWLHLSLQGISESVGFRSRTTFNKAFQKQTGFTYSEYRKRIASP